ncbi:MAG: N-acetyltransferase [bacterium]
MVFEFHESRDPKVWAAYPLAEGMPLFDPSNLRLFPPDAHWLALADGAIAARCSLWWTRVPSHESQRIGLVGHYAARDEEASTALLHHALDELRKHGCTLAVGPMDGNTMRPYRFVTKRGDILPFLMEPNNPDEWPLWWRAVGFKPCATYTSGLNSDLTVTDRRMPEVAARLTAKGVTIRTLDPTNFSEELDRIYAVAAPGFADNFLASPFSREEFRALYLPLQARVVPGLVLIAEHNGEPVGFMFNISNYAEGATPATVIMKTFAVLPGRAYAGLGNLLLGASNAHAYALGYRQAIYALIWTGNNSRIIADRFAIPFREYTLFAKELAP